MKTTKSKATPAAGDTKTAALAEKPVAKSARTAKPKAPPKPKPTAEERKAKRLADKQAAEAREKAAREKFERDRPQLWLRLWAKALRARLLLNEFTAVAEDHEHFSDDFTVDAEAQTFNSRALGYGGYTASEATLTQEMVDNIESELDMVPIWVENWRAEQERLRLEAEQRHALIQSGKAKLAANLSEQELAAMGITHLTR